MCKTAKTSDALHPFEQAGLGLAPFRYVGVYTDIGPRKLADGTEVGSPGQPMGSCDYCGNGIADCYQVESADGNRFKVGCDCIEKVYKASATSAAKRDPVYQAIRADRLKANREKRHAREKRQLAEAADWVADNRAALEAYPDPEREGDTLADKWDWFKANAGTTGKLKTYKWLRRLIETRQAKA